MRVFLTACFAAFLTFTPNLIARSIVPTERVLPSIVKLTIDSYGRTGHCTAFSINQLKALYLTAGHCVEPTYTLSVDGFPVTVLKVDSTQDIALIRILRFHKPALKLGESPNVGEIMIGFGWGMDAPSIMFFPGYIISLALDPFQGYELQGLRMIFSTNFMPGMSGGPITNGDGRLISLVQCGGMPGSFYHLVGCGARYTYIARMINECQSVK